jgi:four helix bundle protein
MNELTTHDSRLTTHDSRGSSAELYTQSIISDRIGYLEKQDFEYVKQECQEILAMLTNLIKHSNSAK